MLEKKQVFSYTDDENVPIQKLNVKEQLRLTFRALTKDDADELKADNAVTRQYMELRANFIELLRRATRPLRSGEHKRVVIKVPNAFDPVMDSVLESASFKPYYVCTMTRPQFDYKIKYDVILEVRLRDITDRSFLEH